MLSKAAPSQVTLYKWDSQNRLIEVDQEATQASASVIANYTYDPAGNRVQKIELNNIVTAYLIDNKVKYARVLEEDISQGGATTATTYTWGDRLLSLNRSGQASYFHSDVQASIKALTNANGLVTDTYSYDAYGNIESQSGTTVNSYRYTGEYFDSGIRLQYNRARYYEPQAGRFASLDPFSGTMTQPLTLNKYIYANGNPVFGKDPSGLANNIELVEGEEEEEELDTQATENELANTNKFKNIACQTLSDLSQGVTRQWHHFYPKALGGRIPYEGYTVEVDFKIHQFIHQVIDEALFINDLPGLSAGGKFGVFQTTFEDPEVKKAGQIALLGAAKFVDGKCAGVQGYKKLTPFIEQVIKDDDLEF